MNIIKIYTKHLFSGLMQSFTNIFASPRKLLSHFLSISLILCICTSCGTVVNNTKQGMSINTTPNGATVKVNGFNVGTTPCNIKIDRQSSNAIITLDKKGYKQNTLVNESKVSGWFWGNFLWSYLFPLSSTTDAVTGGMYEYDQNSFFVALDPLNTGAIFEADKTAQIKKFVLTRYSTILQETSSGGGENLDALKALIGYKEVENKTYLIILKNSIKKSKDADDLAEILIKKAL